jgi:hypothetical protein
MSRWGWGLFDNDTAADFADDLDDAPESERVGMIHDALAAVGSCDSYLDGFRAQVALGAAALVARNLTGGEEFQSQIYGPAKSDKADEWFAAMRRLRAVLVGDSPDA